VPKGAFDSLERNRNASGKFRKTKRTATPHPSGMSAFLENLCEEFPSQTAEDVAQDLTAADVVQPSTNPEFAQILTPPDVVQGLTSLHSFIDAAHNLTSMDSYQDLTSLDVDQNLTSLEVARNSASLYDPENHISTDVTPNLDSSDVTENASLQEDPFSEIDTYIDAAYNEADGVKDALAPSIVVLRKSKSPVTKMPSLRTKIFKGKLERKIRPPPLTLTPAPPYKWSNSDDESSDNDSA
jgi:hypothetical protein